MSSTRTLDWPRAAAPIDPRIRARRIAVRRHAGRRRLQRLFDAGLLLLVLAGFAAALRSPLLDVDEVAVAGATRTEPAAVRAALGIARGDQLMDLDLRAAGERVVALPWVREAEVRRGVDGLVTVTVVERTPVAVIEGATGSHLVDGDGRVLAPVGAAPPTTPLVTIAGVPADVAPGDQLPRHLAEVLAVAARLSELAPGAVTSLTAGDGLRGALAGGGEVRFGDAGSLDAKLRSLVTVLEQVDLACLAVLDVRLPGSPVLTREEACS